VTQHVIVFNQQNAHRKGFMVKGKPKVMASTKVSAKRYWSGTGQVT
jgi:hypothetical protein